MTKWLSRFLVAGALALFSACTGTNEIHALTLEWGQNLPTDSRLSLTGYYEDTSPDLIGTSTFPSRLQSCFFYSPGYQETKGGVALIQLSESPDSITVTGMNRSGLILTSRRLNAGTDYRLAGNGLNLLMRAADLRSGEGGSVVHITHFLAKGTDGTLLVKTTEESAGGVFEQWHRFPAASAH